MTATKQPPAPATFRSGQWVRFSIDDAALQLVAVDGKRARLVKPSDPAEVERMKGQIQKSKCGRFVGIHVAAARTPTGKNGPDGQPEYVHMPACVAPQRAILGPNGEQNLAFLHGSQALTVMFPLDCLTNVEAVLIREDVPKHRDATCAKDWNPRR
jgi:hypothetical protein